MYHPDRTKYRRIRKWRRQFAVPVDSLKVGSTAESPLRDHHTIAQFRFPGDEAVNDGHSVANSGAARADGRLDIRSLGDEVR
jgi:hypothetical protein